MRVLCGWCAPRVHAGGMTSTGTADVFDREQKWARLDVARTQYEQWKAAAYDEVLVEVTERVASTGSIGKSDIGDCRGFG
jgi:hypothetical protein